MRTMKWMIVAVAVLATPAFADNDARCQRAFRYVSSKCPALLTGLSCRDTPDKVQAAYDQCHDGGGGGGGGGGKAPAAPPKDNKDSNKDTRKDSAAVRCTVTKIAGHDTSLDVPMASKMFAETDCRTNAHGVAEKWFAANAKCDPGKTVFPFTFTFGPPGKETTFNHTYYCPKTK